MSGWSGKSKGGELGYRFFIALARCTNIKIVYFFIYFVAFHYLLFTDKKGIQYYFSKILGYSKSKTVVSIYKNFCLLGQVIIDKIIVLGGIGNKFTFDFEGENYLREIVENGKGGLLVGAHMGNWEVAGELLERLQTRINIVMYDAEKKEIKTLMENNLNKETTNIIAIKEDFSHLYQIRDAFKNNELVVMHGDRFLPGTNTVEIDFMSKKALFPTGPLYLASKNEVPVCFVYSLKEKATHYHFYASKPVVYKYPANLKTRKEEIKKMVLDYTQSLERIIKLYPLQWFNYHQFWNE